MSHAHLVRAVSATEGQIIRRTCPHISSQAFQGIQEKPEEPDAAPCPESRIQRFFRPRSVMTHGAGRDGRKLP
ncbi:hypothetical protein GCM10010497_62910 [Streptomyces cinereoruber]|uniref:Uncharacterized protein n=1 Tax=Streptomyces cinereoruber TaxID=67260 RepID=A0AAV4KSH5_9ACTN|nr:hypothetical protein GCM10010497_62910 [Streptomyces cinereoruber]